MRRQRADICDSFNLDSEQRELCAIARYSFKRNMGEPQKACWIARLDKSFRKRCLDQIEIGFGASHHLVRGLLAVWRLPLRRLTRNRKIVMNVDGRRPTAAA